MPKTVAIPVGDILRLAGQRLRAVRDLASVTQEVICEVLRVDQSTWSKWERGERMPALPAMLTFCDRFGLTLDFIFRGDLRSVHPDLAQVLRIRQPHLVEEPATDPTPPDTDQAIKAYKASVDLNGYPRT